MCGIAGFNFIDRELLQSMNDVQAHRGPDGGGMYLDDVSLGHRRLAIIDTSQAANQPMIYKHYAIVFNGEIYNFQEIKAELVKKNHTFNTKSDTEVVLHAFKEWGIACQERFNGMWAFCIFDKKKRSLFLSRDRFGIKPLYYYFNGKKLIFASEIYAIRQHDIKLSINKGAINFYFYQKYIGGNQSIFEEIKKLEPGGFIQYDLKSGKFEIKKYYHLEDEIKLAMQIPVHEKINKIRDLIEDAVDKRLISDVPVGSFLSGGIDSSLISGIISRKHPKFDVFTIGFQESSFNELGYAKLVAGNINVKHHYKMLNIDEDLIFQVIGQLNEPFGDPSLIPTFLLSKMTREKVTVALSGDAGDEIFGGYDTYLAFKIAKFFPPYLIKIFKTFTPLIFGSDKNLHFSYKIKKFIEDYHKNINIRHLNWMSQTDEVTRRKLLGNNFEGNEGIIQIPEDSNLLSIQLNDIYNYLSNDILKKVDMASMMNSLETRVPFLDYRLVPLVLSLPDSFKIKGFKTKYLLKQIAKGLLPKKIIRRKKAGFSIPLSKWFKQSKRMQAIISDNMYYKHDFFNYQYAQTLLREHLSGKNDNSRVLWLIFIFNLWYRNNIESERWTN